MFGPCWNSITYTRTQEGNTREIPTERVQYTKVPQALSGVRGYRRLAELLENSVKKRPLWVRSSGESELMIVIDRGLVSPTIRVQARSKGVEHVHGGSEVLMRSPHGEKGAPGFQCCAEDCTESRREIR